MQAIDAVAQPQPRLYGLSMTFDAALDALGLLCPLPVLKARKRLQAMPDGAVLCVLTDDPAAAVDMPHFCSEAGHALLSQSVEGRVRRFLIRKGSADQGSGRD